MPRPFVSSSLFPVSVFALLTGCGVACSSASAGSGVGGFATDGGPVVTGDDAGTPEAGTSPKDLEGWVRVPLPDGYGPYSVFFPGDHVWVGTSRPEGPKEVRLVTGQIDSRTLAFTPVSGPEVRDTTAGVDSLWHVTAITPFDASRTVVAGARFLSFISAGTTRPVTEGEQVHSEANSATAAGPSDVWLSNVAGVLYHVTPAGRDEYSPTEVTGLAGVWAHANVLYMYADDGIRRVALPVAAGWSGASTLDAPLENGAVRFSSLVGTADAAFAVDRSNRTAMRSKGAGWSPCPYGADIPDIHVGGNGFLAVASYDSAWMIDNHDHLWHFDGNGWTLVQEPGAPDRFSNIAAEPDGTLWATAVLPGDKQGTLFRRGAGAAH